MSITGSDTNRGRYHGPTCSALTRSQASGPAERGVTRFYLWRNDDSRAVPLYERLGFVPTGEVE